MKGLKDIFRRYPATVVLLICLVTLGVDFITGKEIRFPLVYVIPIAMLAWMGRKSLAYLLAVVLPVVRVLFEDYWRIPESIPTEAANTVLEAIALCLYANLVGRQARHTREMRTTISTQHEEMEHLRVFAHMLGTTVQGRGISSGLADGTAVVYTPERQATAAAERISREDVEAEALRLDRALAASISELSDLRKQLEAGERADEEIALLEAYMVMLNEPALAQRCRKRLADDLVRAESAVIAETLRMEQMFEGLKQEFMRARTADVRDIGSQILRKLKSPGGEAPHRLASLQPGTVVVAEELLLSDALQMDIAHVAALATERTGPASHVAILVRACGIPAVCDIPRVTLMIATGDRLLVDAEAGTVTVAPTKDQVAGFALRKAKSMPAASSAGREGRLPCVTRDGTAIKLLANISRADEAVLVLEHGLDGVGLFRSEFLFLHADRPPEVEAQTAAYSEVANMLAPNPVVIRTMDLGGDKVPRFAGIAGHLASRAGLRGLAYSLAENTMFRAQLVAIIRSAQKGNICLMFPMVMGVADLIEARTLVAETVEREAPGLSLSIGAMIETPAAAFDIHGILQHADFVSIGTNDLAHSILAMDRGTEGLAGVQSFLHPSVLRATHLVIQAAAQKAVPISVCGEAAGDPAAACLLIGMGVGTLSINPFLAARLRHEIRRATLVHMRAMAERALAAATAREVQDVLSTILQED